MSTTEVMNATGFEQPLSTGEATQAWLADGVEFAMARAAKVLDRWMAYDAYDVDAVYGSVVDRHAAYRALGEAIKRNAVALADASLAKYKADRAKSQLELHTSGPVRAAIAAEIVEGGRIEREKAQP